MKFYGRGNEGVREKQDMRTGLFSQREEASGCLQSNKNPMALLKDIRHGWLQKDTLSLMESTTKKHLHR